MAKAKELEYQLERAGQQFRLLQNISRLLVRDVGLSEALNSVVALVVEFMECDSCLVYRIEDSELVLCASNTAQSGAVGRIRLGMNEGLTGWVARERRLLAIFREAYRDPRFKAFSDLPADTFEAFLSAPILSRRGVMGVINVQHREPHTHTGDEMEMFSTIAELIGCLFALCETPANHEPALASAKG